MKSDFQSLNFLNVLEIATPLIISTKEIIFHFENDFLPFVQRINKISPVSLLRSESLAIADLGAAIYDALDYSLANEEQRTLSSSLENLIDKMTSAEEEDDENDEGIEDGEEIRQSGQCGQVLDLCRLHLATRAEAETHYRAVCRYTGRGGKPSEMFQMLQKAQITLFLFIQRGGNFHTFNFSYLDGFPNSEVTNYHSSTS